MKNKKIIKDFFSYIHESIDHFADIKIDELAECTSGVNLSFEEYQALHRLIVTKTGRQALSKVMVHYGRASVFSAFIYIDGYTGTKRLELINTKTGEPVAEDTLNEEFVLYDKDKVWHLIPTNSRF